jgi:SAM-dependent methyltransferase
VHDSGSQSFGEPNHPLVVPYIPSVTFAVGAAKYDRFMGRYSVPLARLFAEFAGVGSGFPVLDVGCGTGALTGELIARLGADAVWAIDPSESFVAALRRRYPGVRVHQAAAEQLPFEDRLFHATLAQLVVHYLTDPVGGLREMARVTEHGGVVAACVWDHAGGRSPLTLFWKAARQLDPDAGNESDVAGARQGHLAALLRTAGLHDVDETLLKIAVEHPSFEEWWEPFTFGIGRAGSYVAKLDAAKRDRLRDCCREMLPPAPFVVSAGAWAALGRVSS